MSASNFISILFTEHNIPEVNAMAVEQQKLKHSKFVRTSGKREKRLDFDEKKALLSTYCD